MKIALCCQYYKEKYYFNLSLECLEQYKVDDGFYIINKHEVHVLDARSVNAFNGRNALVYGSLSLDLSNIQIQPFDMWMFFDTDIVFRAKHILKMIYNKDDIFMFPYLKRGSDRKYNIAYKDSKGNYIHYDKTVVGEMFIDGGGAGALKFTRKVVENVEPFLFMPGQEVINGRLIPITEDYEFCNKAKREGFKIRCDFNNPVDHHL